MGSAGFKGLTLSGIRRQHWRFGRNATMVSSKGLIGWCPSSQFVGSGSLMARPTNAVNQLRVEDVEVNRCVSTPL